jgi:hypothetical protein
MFVTTRVFSDQSEVTLGHHPSLESAEASLAYTQAHGSSWRGPYVALARAADWREKMQGKFNAGHWRAPVWASESFWTDGTAARVDHYAHVAIDDPTMIAFTPDAAKGEANRQTRMKPGRYLNRFYPDLGAKRIAFMAEWWAKGTRPPVDAEGAMSLATTGGEMVDVYATDRVDSCMQGSDCVRVYAAGDLAVAYWTDGEGDVVARALCWPEKSIYGRVYPDPDCEDEGHELAFGTALLQAMEAKGWVSSRLTSSGFNGARIVKEDACYGGYVMPYLDHGYGVDHAGDSFVMSSCADISCDSTDGVIQVEPEYAYECDRCDNGCDDTTEVVTRIQHGEAYSHQSWCESCTNDSTFYCEGLNESVSDRLSQVEVDGGDTMAALYASHEADEGRMWIDADGDYTTDEPEADDDDDDDSDDTTADPKRDPIPVAALAAQVMVRTLGEALGAASVPATIGALCATFLNTREAA